MLHLTFLFANILHLDIPVHSNLSSQGVSDACIAWRKALRKIWKLSPITHCDVVALLAESKPLDVS